MAKQHVASTKPSRARKILGKKLRAYRERAGLTLDEVAERVGKSKATLSKIENGTVGIDVTELPALVRALGGSPATLLVDLELATITQPADRAALERLRAVVAVIDRGA
jgi:transcriptional regulator with XRE-family HTH domain